jgi:hypothetical protein
MNGGATKNVSAAVASLATATAVMAIMMTARALADTRPCTQALLTRHRSFKDLRRSNAAPIVSGRRERQAEAVAPRN